MKVEVIKMYKLSKDQALTPELIIKYIEKNRNEDSRIEKLKDYYLGKHAIVNRAMEDASKPNNRIVNPYASYITDLMTGYFMGEPVKYTSSDDELLETLKAIFNYNDEAAENAELAASASICGVSYEIMYLDGEAQIRFKNIESKGCIPIFENNIEQDLLYFIRYYDEEDIINGNKKTFVEVYSRDNYKKYEYSLGALKLLEETEHSWGLVPITIYQNNNELQGDFEKVISEIDAYDLMESDSLNEMEYFNDCYLVLYGLNGTDANDIGAMKENRVLLLPDAADSKAEWLTKSINDTYVENMKKRIDQNIHKFSFCPAMTDADFAANASGVAMKYKLMGLENATAKKERAFKRGLQRRIELICNMLAVMGNDYDYRAIDIIFNRNIPSNMVEMADVLSKVGHLFSEETQIGLMPLDIDYEAEKKRKEEEAVSGYSIDFTANTVN